jgi:ZIP family zinc transporter
MNDLAASAGWGLVVATSLLAGAAAATLLRLSGSVAATMTAFGGGILLAAVALELVPEADAGAGTALTAAGLVAGTLVYVGADAWLNREPDMAEARHMARMAALGRPMNAPEGGPSSAPAARDGGRAEVVRGESIAAGIFVDGVPESVALGLTVAEGEVGAALLAGILLGNIVEAYGAAQPILAGGRAPRFAIGLLGGIGVALLVATVLGGTVLAGASHELIGTAQAVAAGAVLAVVSIAIVPHAFEDISSRVATAMVLGFALGYVLS